MQSFSDSFRQEIKFEWSFYQIKLFLTSTMRWLAGMLSSTLTSITSSLKTSLKNLLGYRLEDEVLGGKQVDLDLYGQGLQRHLIYSLIKLYANYSKPSTTKSKDFSPDFSLILFEEPEAFLHPSQQDVLSYNLRNYQRIVTNRSWSLAILPTLSQKTLIDIPSIPMFSR